MTRKFIALAGLAVAAGLLVVPSSPGSRTAELCFGATPTITGSGEIDGTTGNDVIVGSDGGDRIRGFQGNDKICAGGGDDRVGGGPGNDEVDGGAGNDALDGGEGTDRILGGDGDDTIRCGLGDDAADGGDGTNSIALSGFEACEQATNGDAENEPAPPSPKPLSAKLTAGEEVSRPIGVKRNARGTFTAVLTPVGASSTIAWRLTFRGLTGPAAAAHIHVGPRGKAGPVLAALCAPCKPNARGTVTVHGQAARQAMLSGGAYVNVHTKRNPIGELRGQIPSVVG